MGNWRTVNLLGTVSAEDLPALAAWVNVGKDYSKFHPLCNTGPSICGLGDWTAERIQAVGNLAERDYTPEDVADALATAVLVAPSLELRVHCGGDWESDTCVATVTVNQGVVSTGPPLIPKLATMSDAQLTGNLLAAIYRPERP